MLSHRQEQRIKDAVRALLKRPIKIGASEENGLIAFSCLSRGASSSARDVRWRDARPPKPGPL
jgi:hypothetical protein